MFLKRTILAFLVFLFTFVNIQAHSQQRIKDFYLSNFKEDGSRDWDVKGEEAVIYDKYVDIKDMTANYYFKDDTIVITSDQARMNKENMDVFLKDNVHIKNKDGATLNTDTLNWQRERNHIETKDWVKATKDSMQITAEGMSADAQLKKADFEKNVEVILPDKETKEVNTVTCSGPLEIDYISGKAVFNKDVVAVNKQAKLFSDKVTLFFDVESKKIIKIISEGNVRIVRDDNIAYAQKATYFANEQRIVLEGRPRLKYFQDKNEDSGF